MFSVIFAHLKCDWLGNAPPPKNCTKFKITQNAKKLKMATPTPPKKCTKFKITQNTKKFKVSTPLKNAQNSNYSRCKEIKDALSS